MTTVINDIGAFYLGNTYSNISGLSNQAFSPDGSVGNVVTDAGFTYQARQLINLPNYPVNVYDQDRDVYESVDTWVTHDVAGGSNDPGQRLDPLQVERVVVTFNTTDGAIPANMWVMRLEDGTSFMVPDHPSTGGFMDYEDTVQGKEILSFSIGHVTGNSSEAMTPPLNPWTGGAFPDAGPDGLVDGENTAEVMTPGYDDANGPTDSGGDIIDGPDGLNDTILGNGGDDTIRAGAGDDVVYGGSDDDSIRGNGGNDTLVGDGNGGFSDTVVDPSDAAGDDTIDGGTGDDLIFGDDGAGTIGGTTGTTTEVGIADEGGVATLLVWDASQLSFTGGNPFPDGTAGLSDSAVNGISMTINANATPVAVGVQDGWSSHFNDGDLSQDLVNNETIDGVTGFAGGRITPEYSYSIQNDETGDIINVYAVEFNGNQVVGFVSDAPMEVGATYSFLDNTSTHPSVPYGDLADTYLVPDTTGGTGGTGGTGSDDGNDSIMGGDGDDTIFGEGGDDTIDGGNDNDLIFGDNGTVGAVGQDATPIALNLSNVRLGSETSGGGNSTPGDSVVYDNVATLEDGTQVSARLVLVSTSDPHVTVDLASSADYEVLLGGGAGVNGETADFRLEFFETASGDPVALNSSFIVGDIDDRSAGEFASFDLDQLTGYGTQPGTSINVINDGTTVTADGTENNNDPNDPDARFGVTFEGQSELTFTLTVGDSDSGFNFGATNIDDFDIIPVTAPSGDGGNDVLDGGDGEDTIFGEGGDDTIDGGADDDLIYGDNNEDLTTGDTFTGPRESFNWDLVNSTQVDTSVVQDTGGVNVTYTRTADTGSHESDVDNHTHLNTAGINSGSEIIDTNSSLETVTNGVGNVGAFQWQFDEPVGNLEFNINDLDGSGIVTINAFGPDGVTPTTVQLDAGANLGVFGNMVWSESAYLDPTNPATTVQVTIPGPVTRITLEHTQGDANNSGIHVTDIYFDTGFVPGSDGTNGEGGDDLITGGEGQDTMFGEGGDDTFLVGSAAEGAGDVIDGGNGPDETTDNDVLDLRGAGPVTINEVADANDEGATAGTVTFADGSTLTFEGIETILTDPTNTAPDAVDDPFTVSEDQDPSALVGNVLTNDTDPETPADLTVSEVDGLPAGVGTPVAGSDGGLITINEDGTVSFDPNDEFDDLAPGEERTTTVEYTVTDPDGLEDTATVTFTVTGVNDDPDAVDDPFTVSEDQDPSALVGNVLTNDTDPETPADLTVSEVDGLPAGVGTPVAGSDGGLITINEDGTVSFDPNDEFDDLAPGEERTTTVEYTVTDPDGLEDTATVTFTVTGVNDEPDAVDDPFTVSEDQDPSALVGNVLTNDTDPETPADLTVSEVDGLPAGVGTPVAGSDGGLITINEDGTVSFDPNDEFDDLAPGEERTTTVEYTVTDPDGLEDTATVTFTVIGVNDDPDAVDDSSTTGFETPVVIDLLANDTDVDNPASDLTVTSATVPASQGTLEEVSEGVFTFTPANGFEGTATVTYTISDGAGGTDTAVHTIEVGDDPTPADGIVDGEETGEDMAPGYDDALGATDGGGDIIDGADGIDDTIEGNGGDDTIDSGAGDDVVDGGDGDDSFVLTDGIDNDTIVGGEGDETEGDTLDVSDADTGDNLEVILTAPETGTITQQGDPDTTEFEEIENIILGAGDDTVTGSDGDDNVDSGGGDDLMEGGEGNDTLISGDGEDTIDGGAGDDSLVGGDEADTIIGGEGDDTIEGLRGPDEIDGGAGDDSILGGADDDTITGGDGADTVDGGDGNNVIDTSGGDPLPDIGFPSYGPFPAVPADGDAEDDRDLVTTGSGDDSITTGDDADTIISGAGNDTINSGIDDDEVDAGAGDDLVTTGEGNDTVLGGDGNDTIYGGLGPSFPSSTDLPDAPGTGPFGPDPVTNNGQDLIDGGRGNDVIFGEDDDDTLIGGLGNDSLDGGIDDDVLTGGEGSDTLIGGQGADTLEGGDDDDTIIVGAGDTATGGSGDDVFTVDPSLPGTDPITVVGGETGEDLSDPTNGGDGDTLDLTGLDLVSVVFDPSDPTFDPVTGVGESGTVVYNNDAGVPVTLTFSEIENVVFDPLPAGPVDGLDDGEEMLPGYTDGQGDQIDGTDGDDDTIFGNGGDDTIDSGEGDDIVDAGDGDDTIVVSETGAGIDNDTIIGGEGDEDGPGDTIDLTEIGADLTVDFTDPEEGTITDGVDTTDFEEIETIALGGGDDTVTGGTGDENVDGGAGDDDLSGGAGDDTLAGGEGRDVIDGGAGDDSLSGGDELDTITGGDGNDTIDGGSGGDVLDGGAGEDSILGGADADTIDGGADDDTIVGSAGDDIIDGGDGRDTYEAPDDVDLIVNVDDNGDGTVDLGGGTDTVTSVENYVAPEDASDNDEITLTTPVLLSEVPTAITGLEDTAVGTFTALNGDVIPFGPAEAYDLSDILAGTSPDGTLPAVGPAGDFTITEGDEGGQIGEISFENFETINFSVVDDLAPGTDGPVDGLDEGEEMLPGYTDGQGDQIDGNDGIDDTIFGNGGDDTIDSGAGDDVVDGGDGDDSFVLTDGIDNDTIVGGEGDETEGDTLDVSDADTGDNLEVILTAPETGTITQQGDPDTTEFEEIENIILGAGDDTVTGSDGDDNVDSGGGDDLMEGGEGNDTLISGDGEDTIDGGAGDDSLVGGDEADTIIGGEGDDTIEGLRGPDEIDGGAGDDSILGGADDDTITGGDGADTVDGGDGNNVIDTSGGDPLPDIGFPSYGPFPAVPADGDAEDDRDLVTTGSGDDSITTGDDADTIISGAGNDTINSGIDDDEVDAGAGDDLVTTGEGNDTVLGGDGNDTIYGGLGPSFPSSTDLPDAPGTGPFGPDPVTNNGQDLIDGGRGNDVIFGEDDDDTLIGGLGNDSLDGGIDDDVLTGGEGSDTLIGGQGADTLEGGDDDDTIIVGAGDTATGGSGDDVFTVDPSLPGTDPITVVGGETGEDLSDPTNGGDGDTLDLTGLDLVSVVFDPSDPTFDPVTGVGESGTVVYNNDAGVPVTLTFSEIENVVFDPLPAGPVDGLDDGEEMLPGYTDGQGDQIDGTDGDDDTIFGNGGDDTIDSGEGDDIVDAGDGDDTIVVSETGAGIDNDTIIGGEGDEDGPGDTIDLTEIGADLTVDFTDPEEGTITDGVDTTDFEEIETIALGGGDDTVTGGTGDENVDGGAGDDDLSGGAGDDTLAGGEGRDVIDGGAGDDSLSGGDELDTITGGDGNDTIDGGSGGDVLDGGAGEDSILGGADADTIDGGADDDTIVGSAGDDIIDGGDGRDTYEAPDDVDLIVNVDDNGDGTVDLGGGTDTVTSVENYVAPEDASDNDEITLTTPVLLSEVPTAITGLEDTAVGTFTALNGDVIPFGPAEAYDLSDILAGTSPDGTLPAVGPAGDFTITEGDEGGQIGEISFENFETINFSVVDDLAPGTDGPVDGLDEGEEMLPGYTDGQGDQIDGNDGIDDTIFGNGGDDTIDSGAGDDVVDGGDGDDSFVLTDGIDNDTIVGGEGDETEGDTLDVSDADTGDNLEVILTAPETGTITQQGDPDTTEFEEIENIILGAGDDTVTGSDGDDNVDSGGGDDLMEGGEGNDTLISGDGEDTIDGGAGDDSLVGGDEADTIIGGEGDDTIEGLRGPDEIDGGAGDDSILGGADDDTITGGDGADTVDGGDGNNVIDTSGGDPLPDIGFPSYGPFPAVPADGDAEDDRDLVTTGSGDDSITTGDDADTIISGAGNDTINSGIDDDEVDAGAGDDLVTTGEGNDTVLGGDGNDTIYGGLGPSFPSSTDLPDAPGTGPFGPDPVTNNGQDLIDGGRGNDVIFGEDDDDTLIGGLGADTLDGGIDDDLLQGGVGQDDMIGGQGADTMEGGDDRDFFIINEREDAFGDVIDGGTGGNDIDRLDLRGLGAFEIVNQTTDADGDSTSGTINFLDGLGGIEGSLTFTEIERLVICFTPGTAIATPRGEMDVTDLHVGDRVITRDNGVQEISWIGRKKLKAADLIADPKLRPVLIKKGSLGNNLPERDMMVSPNHRMLMANSQTQVLFDEREVLVAAKYLVGQPGIHQLDSIGVEYVHVMFENHEVILGDGTWTESFQPGDHSLSGIDGEQRDEIFKLFPSLKTAKGRRAYSSARQSLKAHEAKMLRDSMGGN